MEVFVQNSSLKDSPIVQHYPDVDQAQCGRCAVITLVTAQPRTSAQPHLGTSLGTSARDSVSPPTLTTGGATWPIPCKFHDNNTRPAAPQQPVPAVVMTECGGVMIEIICRKIFLWQTNKLYKHSSPHQSPVTTGYRPTQSNNV